MIKNIINKVYKQSIQIQFLGIMPALGILKVKTVTWKWMQYYVKQCTISILIIKKTDLLKVFSSCFVLSLWLYYSSKKNSSCCTNIFKSSQRNGFIFQKAGLITNIFHTYNMKIKINTSFLVQKIFHVTILRH